MQSLTLLATIALAALTSADARACTDDERRAIVAQQGDYQRECKTLFNSGVYLDFMEMATDEQIASLSQCKNQGCLDGFKKLMPYALDCEAQGQNLKTYFGKMQTMCEMFAKGPVTREDLVELYKEYSWLPSSPAKPAVTTGMPVTIAPTATTPAPSATTATPTTTGPATTVAESSNTTASASNSTTTEATEVSTPAPVKTTTAPVPSPTSSAGVTTVAMSTTAAAVLAAALF